MAALSIEHVNQALASVEHPSFGKSMQELGLFESVRVDGARVLLRATVHAPSAPQKREIAARIERALAPLGVTDIDIDWQLQVPMRATSADDPVPGVKNVVLVMSGKGG